MALFHDSAIAGASGQAAGGAYKIERSLRFNSSDSAYLSRTPASAGNRKTWTYSFWLKRTNFGAVQSYLFSGPNASGDSYVFFNTTDTFAIGTFGSGAWTWLLESSAVFRDSSAWYHFVASIDTTQATASERAKIYVNGSQITAFSTSTYPSQNFEGQINNNAFQNKIGADAVIRYSSGYLADVHFIDGQALTPSSFAETNATTGQWVPKAFSGGSYGTNGFRLAFADNSNNTATTLGKDSSPNGNNWTPNNLSVTAGAGNDSLVDTPTSYGSDTGAGGEVRGNYCTWNPLARVGIYTASLSNGNLDCTSNADARVAYGSIAIPSSGKWFFEVTVTTSSTGAYVGVASYNGVQAAYPQDTVFPSVTYYGSSGQKDVDGVYSTYGAAYTNAVIGVAVNVDSSQVTFYKDGVSQGVINKSVVGTFPFVGTAGGTYTYTINAGQRPFAYTAPSGFKALCDTNLPAPVVAKPNTVMDVTLWTGDNTSNRVITSSLNYNPDLVWVKARSASGYEHAWFDALRSTNMLASSNSAGESTFGGTAPIGGYVTNAGSGTGGFTVTPGPTNAAYVNQTGVSYVAWTWDAGSSTATNTQGSITSQVRANASAGFSIVSYVANGTNGTSVGHGLNVKPAIVIQKNRTNASDWLVLTQLIDGTDDYLLLNSTAAAATAAAGMTSTTFGSWDRPNGNNMIAYCFAPVAGYSSFGSYTGNGSTDGPFVYTGFRPKWFLVKRTDSANAWVLFDSVRGTFNLNTPHLQPHLSNAEANVSTYGVDFLSNGIKPRATDTSLNSSGGTYIYAAFAENPFQYARAR